MLQQPRICQRCGAKNTAESAFCAGCGRPMAHLTPAGAAQPPPAAPRGPAPWQVGPPPGQPPGAWQAGPQQPYQYPPPPASRPPAKQGGNMGLLLALAALVVVIGGAAAALIVWQPWTQGAIATAVAGSPTVKPPAGTTLVPTTAPGVATRTPTAAPQATATTAPSKWESVLSSPGVSPRSAGFAPDGRTAVWFAYDGTLSIYDVTKRYEQRIASGTYQSSDAFTISPDGSLAAATSIGGVKVWDIASGKEFRTLGDKSILPSALGFAPGGKAIATGEDQKVRIWDVGTGKETKSIKAGKYGNQPAEFWPDAKTITAGNFDSIIRQFNADSGAELRSVTGASAGSLKLSPDGRSFAFVQESGKGVKVWDAVAWKEILTLTPTDYPSMAFSTDGKSLAIGQSSGLITVYDIPGGKERYSIKAFTDTVGAVAFSPDGKLLAGGARRPMPLEGKPDQMAKLWDASSGKEVQVLQGKLSNVNGVLFSPDSKTLILGFVFNGPNGIEIWGVR